MTVAKHYGHKIVTVRMYWMSGSGSNWSYIRPLLLSSSGSGQNVERQQILQPYVLLTCSLTGTRHVSITALECECHKVWLALNHL